MNRHLNTVIIGFVTIAAAIILGGAYKYKYKHEDTIVVTGAAEKDFVSDLIVWQGNYSKASLDLKQAYASLKSDEATIKAYFLKKGIAANEAVFSSINISKNYNNKYDGNGRVLETIFAGYSLTQNVTLESTSIEKVEAISREVTELIQQGIEFNSTPPSYYYTKLSELKIDLLAKASEDAKNRAHTIAKNAGSSVGELKSANMGVFQIIGKNSGEDYSYGGAFNTASKQKTATITLKAAYSSN